jgi:phosphate transport system permease protein
MSVLMLFSAVLVLAIAAFLMARQRALASAEGNPRLMHSLPGYYGWNGAIWVLIPALGTLALWLILQPMVVENRISSDLPAELVSDATTRALTMADVRRVADGLDTAVAAGAMTENEAGMIRTEFTNVRDRLASVGVALGSDVSPAVLAAAQDYRELTAWGAAFRTGLILVLAVGGLIWAVRQSHKDFRARNTVERVILGLLIAASSIAILTTVGIIW